MSTDSMPVFVIKAKDELALKAISEYRDLCLDYGLPDQATEVDKALAEFRAWRSRHADKIKLPDHKHVPASGIRPAPDGPQA